MAKVVKKAFKSPNKKAEPIAALEPAPHAVPGHGYVVGRRVSHPMFGDGTVTAVEGDRLTIRFKGGRVKLIVAAFVKPR